jgi:hypothetical protein
MQSVIFSGSKKSKKILFNEANIKKKHLQKGGTGVLVA